MLLFGEDMGYLGDVNQGFAGLQGKYGLLRVSDTAASARPQIAGQAIGLAMRGLRPIAGNSIPGLSALRLAILSIDLATPLLSHGGRAKAGYHPHTWTPAGSIWHAVADGVVVHALRGIHKLVPRNAGCKPSVLQHALLLGDEPDSSRNHSTAIG
ncbi:MAG: hypothetical protein IPL78_05700 [Chloroflexi bacterium]|nr:hypothetical protein [Chloroflexota bacterium]